MDTHMYYPLLYIYIYIFWEMMKILGFTTFLTKNQAKDWSCGSEPKNGFWWFNIVAATLTLRSV